MQHEEGDVNAIPRCWQKLQVTAVRQCVSTWRSGGRILNSTHANLLIQPQDLTLSEDDMTGF